jgi:hypothetical protein
MKDYFMGLRANGDWFTSCSAIGSLTLNSSSSSVLGFSLGLYRMVHSIAGSIGRMVEFFDRSPCMKKIGLGSYNSFSAAIRTLPKKCARLRVICARSHSVHARLQEQNAEFHRIET